jgi:hypothetical protein
VYVGIAAFPRISISVLKCIPPPCNPFIIFSFELPGNSAAAAVYFEYSDPNAWLFQMGAGVRVQSSAIFSQLPVEARDFLNLIFPNLQGNLALQVCLSGYFKLSTSGQYEIST